jgi:hypothetical protein
LFQDLTGSESVKCPSNVTALVVLALAFAAVDDLFTGKVAHALKETALLELASHAFVDTILDGVDVLVARDLGLVELA